MAKSLMNEYGLEVTTGGDLQLIQYGCQEQACANLYDSIYGMQYSKRLWHTNTGGNPGLFLAVGGGDACMEDTINHPVGWCAGAVTGATRIRVGHHYNQSTQTLDEGLLFLIDDNDNVVLRIY